MNRLLAVAAFLLLSCSTLVAQTATLSSSSSTYSSSGGSVTFTATLSYSGTLSALGLSVATVPAGWTYGSTAGSNVPG